MKLNYTSKNLHILNSTTHGEISVRFLRPNIPIEKQQELVTGLVNSDINIQVVEMMKSFFKKYERTLSCFPTNMTNDLKAISEKIESIRENELRIEDFSI